MKHSEKIDLLAPAVLAAQREMKNQSFDSENPHFGNEYVSLPKLLEYIRGVFNKYEISFLQFPVGFGGLETVLLHATGQWISETATGVPAKPNDPQALGSLITYLRRYGGAAVSGIAGDADDDGNAASSKEPEKKVEPVPRTFVTKIKEVAPRQAGKYTIHDITFTNGIVAGTFKQELSAMAYEMLERGDVVEASVTSNRFGYDITSLRQAPPGAVIEDDDLPF